MRNILLALMTLIICTSTYAEKDYATKKLSDNKLFLVSYESKLEPIEINHLHAWIIHIQDTERKNINDATIKIVSGGMPEHNHGFPTTPQITKSLSNPRPNTPLPTLLAAPTITTAASNQVIDCNTATNTTSLNNWLASNGGATASVDCGVVNWSNNFTNLTDACGATGVATVIFTAENDCGQSVSTTATFTIQDTIAPIWSVNPSDITIEWNGTADPRGEVSTWLSTYGGASISDACGVVTISDDYTVLATTGCSGTGTATVTFTATDECSLTSSRTATLTIVDTTAPELSIVNDVTIDCDNIPVPVTPTVLDSCDATVGIVYNEVTIYHPSANWKSTGSCSLIHSVSAVNYDNKGTTGDTSDDEMTFTITVIGQHTSTGWSAMINGSPINGEYHKTYQFGPFLSNGSILNFIIRDLADGSCVSAARIDAVDF